MVKKIIIFIFALGIFFPAQAQEVITYEQAVKLALENNYGIRIEMQNAALTENNVTIGNAGFLPVLDVIADQNFSINNTDQIFITGEENSKEGAQSQAFNAGAILNWTIFDGFRMFATYKQLNLLNERSLLEVQQEMENTIANVAAVYYQIMMLQQNIYAIEEALTYSERVLALTRDKKEIGTASALEVMQTEVDVNADKAALIDQKEALKNAKIRLNQLMVKPGNDDFAVTDTFIINPTLDFNALLIEAQQQNYQLLINRKNSQIARKDLEIVKSEYWPQVGLNAGYNYATAQSESGFLLSNRTRGLNYGITASVNLFNGFNTNRRKENAQIQIKTIELQQEALLQELQADLLVAYNVYQNNLQRLELETANAIVARQTLEISVEKERLGDIAGIELREAQQNFLLSQNRLVLAEYNAKMAEIELLRLSGQLMQIESTD